MAVFRVEKTKDFTIMSNHHLRNTELSLKAKGLLSLMLSLPEDWDYTTKGLAHICKDGVDSITTALKELERHGYLTRQRLRYDNGQLGDIEYTIHEQPVSTENTGLSPKRENPRQVKPEQAKPKQAEPEQENPAQLNTNPLKTKKSKKDKSITYPSIYPAEPEAANRTDGMDRIELIEAYREIIKENIEYAIHFNDGKHTYSKNEDWKPGTYYVTKGYSILRTNFETKEAALKWVQELAKGRNKNGKIRFVPPQLAHVKRTGPDYRNGVEITGQHYLDTFGFRGGEFGNWMNQNDRQTSLNMGFEALKDLASALKISDKDIAYQGTLAIAFGARGSGNAAAHYEPLRTVINLTKMHGAGSLAHEWWHGLDDYLGTKMGAKGMLSEQPRLYAPFQKLIDTMKYKPETPEQAAKRTEAQTERTRKNAASWLDSSVLASLKRYGNEEQMETYAVLREAFLSGEPGSVEQISAFKKNVTGRVIPKSERERLEIFERMLSGMQAQEAPQIGRTETDFYRNSVRMGKECEKDGGYWDSNVEMTARAFACYIKDKLPYTSDYLAGHADCALTLVSGKDGEMEVLKAFPVGEERRAINAVFDEIIQDLKREQLLTHADVTFPLSVSELREAADGQLSMFGVGRPSVMDQLAANRPADKKSPAQTVSRKNHEPEI